MLIRGGKKAFRTFDHSMVFELVKQKVITEEQARLSAQSNVITRALGMKPDLEVDVLERSYDKGDRFVLCSDGIHGSMPEKELLKLVANRRSSLGAVVDDIATYVDNLGRSNGGHHDNLTLAIIETKINSKLKEKMSRLAKNLILALSILCVASVALNFYQGCNARSSSCPVDSTATKQQKTQVLQKDSTTKAPQDSVKKLNKKQEKQ